MLEKAQIKIYSNNHKWRQSIFKMSQEHLKQHRSSNLLTTKTRNTTTTTNDSRKEIIHCPRYDHVHWHGSRSRLQQLTN
jgi:hypothetical protein